LNVTKNNSLVLGITGTTPISYGFETDVAGNSCPNELSCSLSPDNGYLGGGTWTFNYSTDGNENYTAISITKDIVVEPIPNMGSIFMFTPLNYGDLNYVEGIGMGLDDGDVVYTLYRDGVEVSNPDTTDLGAGTYTYLFNSTAGQNFTASANIDEQVLTVDPIATNLNLFINGTEGNVDLEYGTLSNVTCFADNSQGNVNLTKDQVQVAYGVSPQNHSDTLAVGIYNYTCEYEATQNYTGSMVSYMLNITAVDSDYPIFSDKTETPTNATEYYPNINYEFNIEYKFNNPQIEKINNNDLLLTIPINYKHSIHPFFLNYPLSKNLDIKINVDLEGKSNVIQLDTYGILNNIDYTFGRMFIVFVWQF
jgi:hypothetical protein